MSAEVSPIEGTRDWGPTGESKWTLFGSFCTRQLLRDSTGPAGSLLWAYSGAKMGQNTSQRGGAHDRPTRGCLLLRRAQKAHDSHFDSVLE